MHSTPALLVHDALIHPQGTGVEKLLLTAEGAVRQPRVVAGQGQVAQVSTARTDRTYLCAEIAEADGTTGVFPDGGEGHRLLVERSED